MKTFSLLIRPFPILFCGVYVFICTLKTSAQTPVELISTNSGFNNGSLSPWTKFGDVNIAGPSFSACRSCPGYAVLGVNSSGAAINNASGRLERSFTIPSNVVNNSNAALQFWYYITTSETNNSIAYDTLHISVKNSQGAGYFGSASGLRLSNQYNNTGYWLFSISLQGINTFAGQTVTLAFEVENDGAKPTTFRIDDVSLVVQTFSTPQNCVQWAFGVKPLYAITEQAMEFLCEGGVIANNQDAASLNTTISKIEVARCLKSVFFEPSEILPSDYYPNIFVDLNALPLQDQSALKMLLYMDYQDGVEPLTRDFFNVLPNVAMNRSQAFRMCLEMFDVSPNMLGYNPWSSATSTFYTDVPVNHKDYGYLQVIAQNNLWGAFSSTCFPSPCISPHASITKEEFYVLLYNIIQKYTAPHPTVADFFVPNNVDQASFGNNYSIDRGIFTSYEDEHFNITGGGLPLNFTHYYNSLLTEMPFTSYEMPGVDQELVRQKFNPIGIGWSHSYNIFIQRVPNVSTTPYTDAGLMIWWPDGIIHSYNSVLRKYNTEGVTDKLTILQTDGSGNAMQIEIKKKNGIKYFFSSDHTHNLKLYEIRDRNSNTTLLTYENITYGNLTVSRLKIVTDSFSGRALTFQYQTGTNYVTSVTDNISRTIRFDVDKTQRLLASFTDAKNQKTEYTYGQPPHAYKVLTKIKRPNGNYITNDYNKKKLKSSEGNNYKITVDYKLPQNNAWSETQSSTVITRNGTSIQTNYIYNTSGSPKQIEHPGGTITYEYSNTTCPHSPTKMTDAATGITTYMRYDGNCNPKEIEPTGNSMAMVEIFEYNSEDQVTAYTNKRGGRTTFTYDTKGNLTQKKSTHPFYIETKFEYNLNGMLRSIDVPDEGKINFTYNSYGNVRQSEMAGKTETYLYDAVSRLTSATDADNKTTTYTYDPNDNILTENIDPSGLSLETVNTYDANDNLITVRSPKGNITYLTYDFLTDALHSERIGTFTKFWQYNEDGSPNSYTDRNGHANSYLYFTQDSKKGLLRKYANTEYDYDSKTLYPTLVKEGSKEISYTNDEFGRVVEIAYNDIANNKVNYVRDQNGNVTKRTYPLLNGKRLEISLTYDLLDRLTEVKNVQSGKVYVKYTYRQNGSLSKEELGNGLVIQYSYDQYAYPNKIVTSHPQAGTLITLQCQRTPGGKITEESSNFQVPGTLSPSNYWNPSSSRTYSFEQTNRITASGTKSFVYANWNLSLNNEDTLQYSFNDQDNLISLANTISGKTSNFEYDPLENRRRFNDTRYLLDLLDNENLIATTDLSGQPQSLFIYGLGLVCRIDPVTGAEYYYHSDWKGNTIAVSDSAHALIKGYYYSPFGEDIQTKGSIPFDNPFTYVGKYGIVDDKNGHFYMRARYYHAKTGRFISEDPVWSTNLFPYADSDPINGIDPNGESLQSTVKSNTEATYTMEQFLAYNQGLTYLQISLQRRSRNFLFKESTPGGPMVRYVTNPADGKRMDMRHVMLVGNFLGVTGGKILEKAQGLSSKTRASALNSEDYYSNQIGSNFADYVRKNGISVKEDWALTFYLWKIKNQ